MAESLRAKVSGTTLLSVINENSTNVECAVCLQTCIHPAELPCGHIFCYLCIKGIVNQGRRCAMCRQDIPVDYLDRPRLLKPVEAEISSQGFEDGHLWFYEGHNGWWQYDERTSVELESAYQKGERCCELLIAGFLYIADFDAMLQYRRNDPSRRRRIKRDLATTSKKGVAGLKSTKDCNLPSSNTNTTSSDLTQSLPNSVTVLPQNLGTLRSHSVSSLSSNISAQQQPEEVLTDRTPRHRNLLDSARSIQASTNSNITPETEGEIFSSRSFDLDSIIHDTLDWTIEQIESLNLELLNDYEVLFRDVNNYGQLQSNINENRSGRRVRNYLSQYLNLSSTLNEPLENQLEAISTTNFSAHQEDSSPSDDSPLPQDANSSVINETESDAPVPTSTSLKNQGIG